ncbi:alpha/beta hydrolase [Microbacterium sp. MPKO10]|uniref:alpha/beta hydrolase n=1 Tax=Microbacterium sp. MPKO10 TaxID=2989818 RepID=UPI00223698D1|nr:alpha/beta hydrolase-fold protein [Microbacterium sp. MPKO10]MCW4458761.1 alpha/beta hydrolase-fold protein [Microbacterium sp. MPKO10]
MPTDSAQPDPQPTDTAIDPDAVLWSASEADREGRPLLVLMHGYGSNESDLFGLAPSLPLELVIASVRAPHTAPWPIDGWSWFTAGTEKGPDSEEINDSARAVLTWLDNLTVTPPSVGLLGFSQGGAMVLQLLRNAPSRFAYGLVLSGFIAPGEEPGDADLAERKPPVFWGRGSADDVIAESAIVRTTDWLPTHSTLSGRIYEGLSHGINQQGVADIRAFIERNL